MYLTGRFHYNELFVFCGCEPQPCTLLHHGFWASTPNMPKIAVSLKLFKDMTLLMIELAVSAKAFIQVLRWKNGWSESEVGHINVMVYQLLSIGIDRRL
jgi:hypothetical protein